MQREGQYNVNGIAQEVASTSKETEDGKSADVKREWKATKVTMEGVKTSNKFASLQEEYNIEFPAITTSQNEYADLIEDYKRMPDLILF